MTPRTRRQVLRSLGVVATGTALTAGALGRLEDAPDRDARQRTARAGSEGVEWHRTFGNGDYQCQGVVDTQDGVLLVGRTGGGRSARPWLAAVGPDGDSHWTTTFDTPGFTTAVDAVAEGGGYTVLATTDSSPSVWLTSLDDNGREQHLRSLETPGETAAETTTDHNPGVAYADGKYTDSPRVLHSTGDGYLVGGFHGHRRARTDGTERAAWVRAVDGTGETRWNRLYDGRAVSDIRSFGEGYLLAGVTDGDAWLQAVGPDGAPRWQHRYGGVRHERGSVAIPTERGVLYGGNTHSVPDSGSRGVLVRTTGDGEFVWRRTQDVQDVADLRRYGSGFVVTGEPQGRDPVGRAPEKPVSLVDRWGRVRQTVTVSVDPGAPVGLGTFEGGGVAVGGWDGDRGVWLARVDVGDAG